LKAGMMTLIFGLFTYSCLTAYKNSEVNRIWTVGRGTKGERSKVLQRTRKIMATSANL